MFVAKSNDGQLQTISADFKLHKFVRTEDINYAEECDYDVQRCHCKMIQEALPLI